MNIFGTIAALATLGLAGASRAAVINVTDVELAGPGPYYTISDNVPGYGSETFYADPLVFTETDGTKLYVNCDDLVHTIGLGGQNLSFTVGTVGTNFRGGTYTINQIGSMAYLDKKLNAIIRAGGKNENVKLAAEQVASWEIANPDVSFFNVDPTVQTLANAYAAEALNKWAPNTQLTALNGAQGQTFSSSVPEASAWVMMILGLGGIGVTLRKRVATA